MNISIKTQNKKGNAPKYQENLGYVTTFLRHSEDRIVVDDYEGTGESYKKRETSEISIYDNGELIFQGCKQELFNKLKS